MNAEEFKKRTKAFALRGASRLLALYGVNLSVPKGHVKIAHRFNGGLCVSQRPSPEGTIEFNQMTNRLNAVKWPDVDVYGISAAPPGLESFWNQPTVETVGYYQQVPSGQPDASSKTAKFKNNPQSAIRNPQ